MMEMVGRIWAEAAHTEPMAMIFGELRFTRVIILLQPLHILPRRFLLTHPIHRNRHSNIVLPYITQTILVQLEIKIELSITHMLLLLEEISDTVEHPVLTRALDLLIPSRLTLKFQVI